MSLPIVRLTFDAEERNRRLLRHPLGYYELPPHVPVKISETDARFLYDIGGRIWVLPMLHRDLTPDDLLENDPLASFTYTRDREPASRPRLCEAWNDVLRHAQGQCEVPILDLCFWGGRDCEIQVADAFSPGPNAYELRLGEHGYFCIWYTKEKE